MRHKVFIRGGHYKTSLGPNGGEATGPILLSRDPQVQLEAATKQYADNKTTNIDASAYTSGTIAIERLPAFTGDITKSEGSAVINITSIGVSAGSYTKATVNQKGQVTAGTVLVESDIPSLDWSKITTDKPTTLAGYGITDALARTNPVMTGALKVNGTFTTDEQLVNKEFVDTVLTPRNLVGDIDFKLVSTTPAKYLRCNGGEVSKTTYAALYSVIGDKYTATTVPGNGNPSQYQYFINNSQNETVLDSWTEQVTTLPTPMANPKAFVTKNKVYLIPGSNNMIGSAPTVYETTNKIYSASISAGGNIGAWTQEGTLPFNSYSPGNQAAFITKNRLYTVGGDLTIGGVPSGNNSWSCDINTDGTLGSWTKGPDLPQAIRQTVPLVTKNRVYLLGGRLIDHPGFPVTSKVYTATYDSNGVVGNWTEVTALPKPLAFHNAFIIKNKAYVVGGENVNGNSREYSLDIYSATIDSDGVIGLWTKTSELPEIVSGSSAYVTKTRVYLISSFNADFNLTEKIYTAPIYEDGSLGVWEFYPAFAANEKRANGAVVATNGYLYYLGGFVPGTRTPSTYPDTTNKIFRTPIAGGLNDYMTHITNTTLITDNAKFQLPDIVSPYANSYAYIRFQQ